MTREKDSESDTSEQTILPVELNRRNLMLAAGVGMTSINGFTDGAVAQSNDRVEWQFETDGKVFSSPAVVNGTVFVGSNDHNVYALDADTGEQEWIFDTGGEIFQSSPTVANGTVYIGGAGVLYALDAATGEQHWASQIGLPHSEPTVAYDNIYLGTNYFGVYALDSDTGDELWQFSTDSVISSSPAVVNTTVYVGADNYVYALDASTGDPQWEFESNGEVRSSPTVVNGTLFIGSEDNNLYALDINSGDEKWAFETQNGVSSDPAVANGTVFIASSDGFAYAVDVTTGDQQWRSPMIYANDSGPTVVDDTVFVGGAYEGQVVALDASTGEQLWAFETDDKVRSSPAVADGTVFVGSNDNHVYALDSNVEGSNDDSDDPTQDPNVLDPVIEEPAEAVSVGDSVTFSAVSSLGNIEKYEWELRDGVVKTGSIVQHVYENTGSFNVRLTITGENGSTASTTTEITVTSENLDPVISKSDDTISVDEYVTVDATSSSGDIETYQWDFGSDSSPVTGSSWRHSYVSPGTYEITLTVTSQLGNTATATTNITVTESVEFSIEPDTPVVGQSISFRGKGGREYEWDFDDGDSASGQYVTHTYEEEGTYTVTLSGASDSITRELEIEPTPININEITREYGGVPLESVPYKDTFRATIENDNQIDTVEFKLADKSKIARNIEDTPEATFDLSILDESSTLIVTATDVDGFEATTQQTVAIAPVPEWMEWLVESAEIAVDTADTQIDITHNPLDLSGYSFGLGDIPIDTGPPGFDSATAGAEVAYDASQQAAVVEGDGGLETELFGYGFEAELAVEGAIDSDLDLVDASGEVFASISGQIGPPLYVNIPPGIPCLDDQLGIETTVAPGITLEADFDGEFDLEKGTVTPETELTVGTELDICGAGAGAEVSGELDASFDVGTSSRNLTGTISAEGDVWINISVFEAEIDAGFEVVLPAGSTQMVANQAQSRTEPGWSVADKRGVQPAIGVSSVDATSITISTTSPLAPTTDASNSFQRLTDRPLEDTQPAMTTVGSETLVLWSSQRESASATAGRDIAYRSTDGTEWSEVEYLTIESRSHEAPAVAASNGSALAVWEHVTIDITENTEPADIHPHIEIAYAIYDGETWSDATVLTDTTSREFQPTVAPSDNGWVIGWEQATAPEADAGQRNVRYTEITTDDTVGTIETIAEAAYPDTGAYADSGAVLGYASLNDGEPTAAVTTRIIGGSQTDSQRFSATAIRSLTVGSDRLIWQEGSVSDPTLVEANRGASGTEELSVRDAVDAIAEPTLSTDGEQAVLSYRAYVETTETRELVYRLNRGSGWIFDRQFVQAPDSSQTVWQPETTFVSGADQFETVFAISETSQSGKNDIFLTEHDFRPAYAIAADGPSGATAGETVTLEYDLRNRGDIDGTQGVTVTVLNAAGTQATKRYPGLAAGETVSDSVVVAVDETGEFKLEITTGEQNLSTVAATSDNFDADSTTVTVATPQLSVEEITTEGSETVGITVSNTGGATAFDVPLRVTDGEAELTSTTINELGYGKTSTTTVSIDPRSIDRSSEDTVELDPDRTLPEAVSESDRVTPTWLLQSDLRVTEEISYRRGTVAQIVADVVVGNSNPVAGTGTLQAKTTDGSVVGETSISIAGTESGTNYTTVSVGLDTSVSEDDTLRFAIDPAVPDADPTTLSQQTTVGSVSETDESGAKVNLLNTTLSDGPVDSTPSSHTLQFTAENVSADNRADSFSIELPEKIDVEEENIKNVTVRNGEYNVTPSVENNTINFDVNPDTDDTSLVDLDIEVDMTLSTNDS